MQLNISKNTTCIKNETIHAGLNNTYLQKLIQLTSMHIQIHLQKVTNTVMPTHAFVCAYKRQYLDSCTHEGKHRQTDRHTHFYKGANLFEQHLDLT